MYLHKIGMSLNFSGSNVVAKFNILADEKSSFTREDLKEGKHIEYAKSLLKKMKKYQRCPSPARSTEQESSFQSDPDWFDIGSSERQSDGEMISESPSIEQTDPDDFDQDSYCAADDDLGKLLGGQSTSYERKMYFRF